MIASLRQKFAPLLPLRSEERSAIDCEIALELAHHLESLKSDLISQGHSPTDAAAEAARRFGPADAHAGACRDIALKEHRMWQKIQIALILILSLALAASLTVSLSMSRQQSALAEALQAQADIFRAQAQTSARRTEDAAASAAIKSSLDGGVPGADRQLQGLVYITGLVARPGPYSLPTTNLTLWRAVISAGGVSAEGKLRVTLTRADAKPGESPAAFTIEGASAPAEDPILRPGDVVSVMRE